MSVINVGCELVYEVITPTSFLFNVAAAKTSHQSVLQEKIDILPNLGCSEIQLGTEGNRIFRLQAAPGPLTLNYWANVEMNPTVVNSPNMEENIHQFLPNEVLPFLNPSRYCESDRLVQLGWQTFGHLAPGYSRVQAICNWTHEQLSYQPGCSDERTSACDVLIQRTGICRDYAHLAIALCRAMCIPARYVTGYAVGLEPPDFHGFFEAYLGSRWYLFDATRMASVDGLVRIGTGRDAADAAFAIIIGAATMNRQNVWANQGSTDTPPTQRRPPGSAVSTA
ncbi:MAG: transglutaminase-like domain-containing protein [Gammaproteobacteria bacterium]